MEKISLNVIFGPSRSKRYYGIQHVTKLPSAIRFKAYKQQFNVELMYALVQNEDVVNVFLVEQDHNAIKNLCEYHREVHDTDILDVRFCALLQDAALQC